MKRVSSQLIFCSPYNILRNCVLELDEHGVLTQVIDLQNQQSETHQTLFYDGIISNGIVSLKMELTDNELNNIKSTFNFFDFSVPIHFDSNSEKPLLVDFGTNDIKIFNQLLRIHYKLFIGMDFFEFLTACCFLPLQILNRAEFIEINHKPNLLIWKRLNLIEKRITPITTVENL